ncbi:MAG: R2-like ligand-binding oxidase [Anaerolineae bacterium]|jgi:ribonucleoside-diphosphate reductase beta chain|nr:MAG: R2-like ligand-binding oxidase [Anaerolineae bacterium]
MPHIAFTTTSRRLDRDLFPMRLYQKAKRLGVWDPASIDFRQDQQDWASFTAQEKDLIWLLLSLFIAGEEAVTLDLLPLIQVVAQEGRLEEEMYLTTFLFEEAKHTDFFSRFIEEVAPFQPVGNGDSSAPQSLAAYHTENYRHIFYEALPQALQALRSDPSPAAQIRASVTYNMIVEGLLAETGYHAFFTMLERNNLLPGLRKGIAYLKQDESRHIAYGIYLLSRLVAEHPQEWHTLESQMNSLLPFALGVVSDAFARYEVVPFGLVEEDFIHYAMHQFSKRFERLEKARFANLDDLQRLAQAELDS